jgi:hypothetical protein
MATVVERVGVLEIKVQHVDEKIDDIKIDIKEVHDCLDRTGDALKIQLCSMHDESCRQHNELASKIASMEKDKNKLMLYVAVGAAFTAGAGWSGAINFPMVLKFFGI